MAHVGREVESWLFATVAFVLAFAGAMAVAYPTVSLVAAFAGSSIQPPGPVVAFSLSFGASYPLVAGGWLVGRLYDVLLVAACCTVLGSVALTGLATGFHLEPLATPWFAATAGWALSLVLSSVVVSRFEVEVFA